MNKHPKPAIYLLLLTLTLFVISACSENKNDQAYIQFSNPASLFKQKTMAREVVSPVMDSLIITIKDTNDIFLTSTNVFNAAETIKLSVPANTPLIVSGEVSIDGITSYFGETTINAIRPGATSRFSLLLYDINSENPPLSVEFPLAEAANQTSPLSKSTGSSFSRDNNFVLFFSDDTSLPGTLSDNQLTNLFIRNFSNTAENNIVTNLHTDNAGMPAIGGDATEADISADGVYVVFSSTATNLVANDTNEAADVFLKNTLSGEIRRLSSPPYSVADKGLNSYNPQISDDGSIVTFFSEAAIANGIANSVFVFHRINETTTPVLTDFVSDNYRLSGDGKVIVYQLKDQEENGLMLSSLALPTPSQALENADAKAKVADNNIHKISVSDANYTFSVSQNGDFTAFIVDRNTDNLMKDQIYLYNRTTGKRALLSKTRTNNAFAGTLTQSGPPALSNDGKYIVFSYDNITYVRNIEYNSLLKIGNGSNPFISAAGDRIGYEENDKLFVIANPLYTQPETATQKALAPSNVTLDDSQEAGIKLTWNPVPEAIYYRVYLSPEQNIADKLNTPGFSPLIFETNAPDLVLDPGIFENYSQIPFNGNGFYFAIVAIDENGEGIVSEETPYFPVPISPFSNEGSVDKPKPLGPGDSEGFPGYLGTVNTGKSYYELPTFTPSLGDNTYAIRIFDVTDDIFDKNNTQLSLSASSRLTDDVVITCQTPQQPLCIIENATEESIIDIVVDGGNTSIGSSFLIMMTEVNVIEGTDRIARSFTAQMGELFGYIWVKNLSRETKYHLTDTTSITGYENYQIRQYRPILQSCDIYNTEGVNNSCRVESTDQRDILLEVKALTAPFSELTRSYELDTVATQSFSATGSNTFFLDNEKFATYSALQSGKKYYLVISLLDNAQGEYEVAPDILFDAPYCQGTLDFANNRFDTCAFVARDDGAIQIKLSNTINNSSTERYIKIELFELPPLDFSIGKTPFYITPSSEIQFAQLTPDSFADQAWISVNLDGFPLSSTLSTYSDLSNGRSCVSNLNDDTTSCEIQNTANNLVVLELNLTTEEYEFRVGAQAITEQTVSPDTSTAVEASPHAYFTYTPPDPVTPPVLVKTVIQRQTQSPVAMQVFNNDWNIPACETVKIGNNLLCLTENINKRQLKIKVFDNHLPLASVADDTSLVDVSVNPIDPPLLLADTDPVSAMATGNDYTIYRLSGLNPDASYRIETINTAEEPMSAIPFYVVPDSGVGFICQSVEQTFALQYCITKMPGNGSGYIIINTPTGVNFEVAIYDMANLNNGAK